MLIVALWRWVCGYVVISAEGVSLEKLLNLCMVRGITLWRVDRYSPTHMEACISMRGFMLLRDLLPRLSCRVSVIAKRGLPMIMAPVRRRMAFALGVVLCAAILILGTQMIWDIRISGCETLPSGAIEERLYGYGVARWGWKVSIDLDAAQARLLLDFPELSWVGMHFNGVNLIVEVVEATPAPDVIPRNEPADVVAAKDGLIESILTLEGRPVVTAGAQVSRGDLLISGTVEAPEGQRLVRANGQVMARIWYRAQAAMDLDVSALQRTGQYTEQTYIEFGDQFRVKVKGTEPGYALMDTQRRSYPLFGEHMIAPLFWVVERSYELVGTDTRALIEQYTAACAQEAYQHAETLVPDGVAIVDKQIESSMIEGNQLVVSVYIETLEDIAQVRRMSP